MQSDNYKKTTLDMSVIIIFTLFSVAVVVPEVSGQYVGESIGNILQASGQGVDLPGVVMLLDVPFPKDGVVFAFQSYFRSLASTAFQIWRPSSNSSQMLTLISEIQVVPSTNNELIYITSKFLKCLRVQKGDWFGMCSFNKPLSIGYVFNPFKSQSFAFRGGNETIQVGQTVEFNAMTFPYDLSVQVFYYFENSNINSSNETTVDCPANLPINDVVAITTTPIPIPSGALGQAGQKGPDGLPGIPGPLGAPGAVGGTGPQGTMGAPGSVGSSGATGPSGLSGSKGITGDVGDPGSMGIGPSGATGPAGQPGPPGQLIFMDAPQSLGLESNPGSTSDDSTWANKWTSEMFMIGLLIWLSILSLMILILLLCVVVVSCVICATRRYDDRMWEKVKEFHHHENDPYRMIRKTLVSETEMDSGPPSDVSPNGTMPKGEFSDAPTLEHWMGAMKEDSVQEYKMWYGVQ